MPQVTLPRVGCHIPAGSQEGNVQEGCSYPLHPKRCYAVLGVTPLQLLAAAHSPPEQLWGATESGLWLQDPLELGWSQSLPCFASQQAASLWGCTYTMPGCLAEAGRNSCHRCHDHREALAL